MKCSSCYFYIKKKLTNFQICISVPLNCCLVLYVYVCSAVQWVPVMDANFHAPLNLWKLAYTESIFIAFLVIFSKKLHHSAKQHSLLSEKYYFMHITSPNAIRFELTIAKGFSNGWTKRLTLLTLFTASIYKICGGVSSGKNKVQNVCPFSEYSAKYTAKKLPTK